MSRDYEKRRPPVICCLAAVLCTIAVLLSPAAAAADPKLEALEEQAIQQAAALVAPSVVRVRTVGGLDRIGQLLTGTGPTTGVVVSSDGYIISSAFNFASKPASVLIELSDGRRLPAAVVATDRLKMLTLLKIDARDLTPAEAAPKDSLRVGQWAIALGRTYDGPLPSISVGVVSALNRIWGKAIQTDAKVSPVNYGGPLVGIDGKVQGILVPLSMQESGETAGVEWYDSGIGFAVPMEDVYAVLDRLKEGKDLHPGLMGIDFKGAGLIGGDPVVDRARSGSPAEKAGLKAGDRIVEIDGGKVDRQAEVKQALGTKYAGDQVAVVVKRGSETIKAELTLVEKLLPYERAFLGILPSRDSDEFEPEDPPKSPPAAPGGTSRGVPVRHVFKDSPAEKAGLEPRDRIVRLNDEPVADTAALAEAVGRLRPGEKATLVYRRGDEEQTADVELASIPNAIPADLRTSPIAPPEQKPEGVELGRFTVEMPQHKHSYWAYVPEDYNPAYRYGLMVWLHPEGDTMEAAVIRAWESICRRRGLIIVAPKAEDLGGWTPNEAQFVKDAVADVTEKYAIDPSRVFVHGYKQGGRFAFEVAFKYQGEFRGVAAASAVPPSRPPETSPEFRQQFHLIVGETDPQRRAVQATAAALRQLKHPTTLTELKEHGDEYPSGEALEELGRWADSLDRI